MPYRGRYVRLGRERCRGLKDPNQAWFSNYAVLPVSAAGNDVTVLDDCTERGLATIWYINDMSYKWIILIYPLSIKNCTVKIKLILKNGISPPILSWCWWNFLTSANQIAQIGSCDRSRIHVPDLGRTGVWPGKNGFHKKDKNLDNIAVYLIASLKCKWKNKQIENMNNWIW